MAPMALRSSGVQQDLVNGKGGQSIEVKLISFDYGIPPSKLGYKRVLLSA